MPYRYEDVDQWLPPLLEVQRIVKPYVTVEQAMKAMGLASKSSTEHRLKELVARGKAEKVLVGMTFHYHIIDE